MKMNQFTFIGRNKSHANLWQNDDSGKRKAKENGRRKSDYIKAWGLGAHIKETIFFGRSLFSILFFLLSVPLLEQVRL